MMMAEQETGQSCRHWFEGAFGEWQYRQHPALCRSTAYSIRPFPSRFRSRGRHPGTAGNADERPHRHRHRPPPVDHRALGTALYVTDDQNGIVLKGVFSANWDTDPETGVLVDHYSRNPSLDEDLVSQLTQRILALLDTPHAYEKIRHNALERSRNQFSGEIFSKDFWSRVSGLHLSQRSSRSTRINVARRGPAQLNECMLADSEWPRVFGGATQPHMRLYTGRGRVSELGGAFIHAFGSPAMEVNDWSVLAEHVKLGAPPLKFAKSIRDLEGSYLDISGGGPSYRGHDLIAFMSRALQPYPALHHFGARVLATARQCRHRVLWLLGADKTRRPDIELVVEGLSGFNIVRCLGKYYAIPQSEGAFVLEKVEAGEYCACFRGNTVWAIRRKIAVASKAELTNPSRSHHDSLKVELVSEGVLGFNIVRCADRFYAIPQSEGTFDHTRIHSGGYSRMFSGRSAEEVHKLLKEAVASLI